MKSKARRPTPRIYAHVNPYDRFDLDLDNRIDFGKIVAYAWAIKCAMKLRSRIPTLLVYRGQTSEMKRSELNILRISSFSENGVGGNPAGVLIADALPDPIDMQRIAAEVGYSETAFAAPTDGGWRVRYFSPESEVPFCGHATIALGAALALREGPGIFPLMLSNAKITVEGQQAGDVLTAALQSPPTCSKTPSVELVDEVLALFGYSRDDLNSAIPPALIHGGADHFVLTLHSRETLAAMTYDLAAGRTLMIREGWITILLAYAQTARLFHTRNPFASGGVYEDPATGAATAAFAGYLRDIDWPHGGAIDLIQGEDMDMRSRLHAEIPPTRGSSIRVSGEARLMD